MESKKEFKLVDSDYLPTDAKNLLFGMLNGKVGFHNLQMMRSLECSDGTLGECEQGLKELKSTKDEIDTLLREATAQGLKVQLKGNIEICVQG